MNKECLVEICDRPLLAKGFCNGHYLRSRNGGSMTTPIVRVEKGRVCGEQECSAKHYSGNFCHNHYNYYRRRAVWEKAVEILGGRCLKCKESYPVEVYDLHHREKSEKSFAMGNAICSFKWETIEEELRKCDLLCANCHRIVEFVK